MNCLRCRRGVVPEESTKSGEDVEKHGGGSFSHQNRRFGTGTQVSVRVDTIDINGIVSDKKRDGQMS